MKKTFITLIILFAGIHLWSQTNQTIIVEHFTNTRCGICSARNPAFYDLLNDYPDVLHIAYHPSSPYASCVFSQHNPTENDARTNYYGIYGGTPRVVVQGKVIAPQNPLLMASQIEEKLGQAADYTISVEQMQHSNEEANVAIVVKKTGDSNFENLNLYAIVVEKEVAYNAPNGESFHHDVFRKVLVENPVSLDNIADSVVLNVSYALDNEWVVNQMYVAVMLEDVSTKTILQSAASGLLANPQFIHNSDLLVRNDLFYPNPASDLIRINDEVAGRYTSIDIYSINGQLVLSSQDSHTININELKSGLYLVYAIRDDNKIVFSKLVKE